MTFQVKADKGLTKQIRDLVEERANYALRAHVSSAAREVAWANMDAQIYRIVHAQVRFGAWDTIWDWVQENGKVKKKGSK